MLFSQCLADSSPQTVPESWLFTVLMLQCSSYWSQLSAKWLFGRTLSSKHSLVSSDVIDINVAWTLDFVLQCCSTFLPFPGSIAWCLYCWSQEFRPCGRHLITLERGPWEREGKLRKENDSIHTCLKSTYYYLRSFVFSVAGIIVRHAIYFIYLFVYCFSPTPRYQNVNSLKAGI